MEQPPVVVETFPVSGGREVEPGETEIRVRFSKEMADGSWSWVDAWNGSAPETIGRPKYDADHKTCVLNVKLEPNRTYAFWLNSENFKGFTDTDGHAAKSGDLSISKKLSSSFCFKFQTHELTRKKISRRGNAIGARRSCPRLLSVSCFLLSCMD